MKTEHETIGIQCELVRFEQKKKKNRCLYTYAFNRWHFSKNGWKTNSEQLLTIIIKEHIYRRYYAHANVFSNPPVHIANHRLYYYSSNTTAVVGTCDRENMCNSTVQHNIVICVRTTPHGNSVECTPSCVLIFTGILFLYLKSSLYSPYIWSRYVLPLII